MKKVGIQLVLMIVAWHEKCMKPVIMQQVRENLPQCDSCFNDGGSPYNKLFYINFYQLIIAI